MKKVRILITDVELAVMFKEGTIRSEIGEAEIAIKELSYSCSTMRKDIVVAERHGHKTIRLDVVVTPCVHELLERNLKGTEYTEAYDNVIKSGLDKYLKWSVIFDPETDPIIIAL